MRLNNRKKTVTFQFINIFIITAIVGSIAFFILNLKMNIVDYSVGYYFFLFSVFIIFLFYLRGKEIFEYDSDGEVLNFRNKSVLFFLKRNTSDEFPKYKLKDFYIVKTWFFKKIYIKIESKKKKDVILRYDISYISLQDINNLHISLSKVIAKNKKALTLEADSKI